MQFSKILKNVLPYFFSANFSKSSSAFTAFACSLPEKKVIVVRQEETKPFISQVMNFLKLKILWRQVNSFINCHINKTTAVFKSHINIRLYEHLLRLSSPLLDTQTQLTSFLNLNSHLERKIMLGNMII